jgi:hypothetical protein
LTEQPLQPGARMRLHWSPLSPFVRKVMVAAHELGLADRIGRVRAGVRPGTVGGAHLDRVRAGSADTAEAFA